MTPKKEKALAALLTSPTVKAAAQETGVGSRTMRLYLKDPEFLAEYKRRCSSLLEDATNKAKAALPPAIAPFLYCYGRCAADTVSDCGVPCIVRIQFEDDRSCRLRTALAGA